MTCDSDRGYVDAPLINGGGIWYVCPYRRFIHVGNYWGLTFIKVSLFPLKATKLWILSFKSCGTDYPAVVLLIVKLYRFRILLCQPRDAANSVKPFRQTFFFGLNCDQFARDVMLLLSLLGNFLHQIIFNCRQTLLFLPAPSSLNFCFEALDCLQVSLNSSFFCSHRRASDSSILNFLFLGNSDFLQT